jgi:hypothetical protein
MGPPSHARSRCGRRLTPDAYELTMMGAKTLEAQIAGGTAKVQGDASILTQLASTMVDFDPRFEIMPGTKAREIIAKEDPYEADPRQPIPE